MAIKTIIKKIEVPHTRPKQRWSKQQKYEYMTAYITLGSINAASEATGIPFKTGSKWKGEPWFKALETELRQSLRIEVRAKLADIIKKAAKEVDDRLVNGDIKVGLNGDVRRVPINAKTASDIMVKSIDRQVILEKVVETPDPSLGSLEDRFKAIEQRLINATRLSNPSLPIIEGELVDVRKADVP